jgi:hypothetical protein
MERRCFCDLSNDILVESLRLESQGDFLLSTDECGFRVDLAKHPRNGRP